MTKRGNPFENLLATMVKRIRQATAQATASTMTHNESQPSENETVRKQPPAGSQSQSREMYNRLVWMQVGAMARDSVKKHSVPDLEQAILKFGDDSFVNNLQKVKNHLTNLGIDISNADEQRLAEIGILLYRDGAIQAGGVLEGLVEVTENTTVDHVRGVNTPPVNVERVLEDYLARRVEILVVSYKHVKWSSDGGKDLYGMSQENFDEILDVVRSTKKRTFLWVDKIRSKSRGIGWSPDCSLMYIAFPGYQMMNVRNCNRLWITTERDSMRAREETTKGEIPALRAYAVLCRNAIRGDYANCPVYWDEAAPFINWAKRLMSKLFTGKLQWGEVDGTECFQHAAVAVLYNYTTLNVFLRNKELRVKELRANKDKLFGPLSCLDLAHEFWPEPVERRETEIVDVAMENAMDWYVRGDEGSTVHFLGRLRQGPQGTTCYRGRLTDFDGRQDFFFGVVRAGEVFNSDSLTPGVLALAFQQVWAKEDKSTSVKALGLDDLLKRVIFESVLTGESDSRRVFRQVAWSTSNAIVVRGPHLYLY